jgi:enoyl-CoA hydratase/carnithine racemase
MLNQETHGRVRVLRLANPPANVLAVALLKRLKTEIAAAAADDGVRCLMLASAYPRYFSTGLDLGEMLALPPERRGEVFGELFAVYHDLLAFPKPTLAAINGSAILGGWILAMGCDFRFLSEGTGRIALSEVRMGLSPGTELVERLSRLSSSPTLVKELVLKGKTLRADEALAGGFVDRLVPQEALEEEALKEARQLCKLPLTAYASVKRSLNGTNRGLSEATLAEFGRLLAGPEAEEGVLAMREKRRPRFAGADDVEE